VSIDEPNARSESDLARARDGTRTLLGVARQSPEAMAFLRRELAQLGLTSEALDRILRDGEITEADLPALLLFNHSKN